MHQEAVAGSDGSDARSTSKIEAIRQHGTGFDKVVSGGE
jgi:hypothetical protein